jgi:hypothetical protein
MLVRIYNPLVRIYNPNLLTRDLGLGVVERFNAGIDIMIK